MIRAAFDSAGEQALLGLLEGAPDSSARPELFFQKLMQGDLNPARSRAFLALLSVRGETTADLLSAWKAIRKVEKSVSSSLTGLMDTCGTGGDGSHSVNLSTLSAFVMTACGVKVLKHGNRAITSRCGSSDLLAAFGMNLDQSPASVYRSINKIGMGYFHAPHIHPVFARFQPLRKNLQIRTLFNLLGPVLNPANIDYQILGIARPELILTYAGLLPKIGRKSALIVQGANGMDEITSLGISKGLKLSGKKTKPWTLNPKALGFKIGRKGDLEVRSVSHAKQKTIEILKSKKSDTAADSVILSAACGIWIADLVPSMKDAVMLARSAIQSGQAWNKLEQLVKFSRL